MPSIWLAMAHQPRVGWQVYSLQVPHFQRRAGGGTGTCARTLWAMDDACGTSRCVPELWHMPTTSGLHECATSLAIGQATVDTCCKQAPNTALGAHARQSAGCAEASLPQLLPALDRGQLQASFGVPPI